MLTSCACVTVLLLACVTVCHAGAPSEELELLNRTAARMDSVLGGVVHKSPNIHWSVDDAHLQEFIEFAINESFRMSGCTTCHQNLTTREKKLIWDSIYRMKPGAVHEEPKIHLAEIKFQELFKYLYGGLFVLVFLMVKVIYHHMTRVEAVVPESIILIILGVIAGLFMLFLDPTHMNEYKMTSDDFFFILLPPIMLEASYSLFDTVFAKNIGSILFLAVFGTLLNFLIVGFGLYAVSLVGALGAPSLSITLTTGLMYASFIVAVDPVAVLAIFDQIGVEKPLYYLVFGESLFNDAVTIVLYVIMKAFAGKREPAKSADVMLGIGAFFTVSLGGVAVGIVMGLLSSVASRLTHSCTYMEPLLMVLSAYLSYILGDMFGWSGIMSIIACGLIQAAYGIHNISDNSRVTLKFMTKVISSIFEAIIFFFLGMALVSKKHMWHTGFILWSLVLCQVARWAVTFGLGALMNLTRAADSKLTPAKLTVMAYGGLRGAVAFALCVTLDEHMLKQLGADKQLFITSTMFTILFTCVIQGLTVKPLITYLKIPRHGPVLENPAEEPEMHLRQTPCIRVLEDWEGKYLRPVIMCKNARRRLELRDAREASKMTQEPLLEMKKSNGGDTVTEQTEKETKEEVA